MNITIENTLKQNRQLDIRIPEFDISILNENDLLNLIKCEDENKIQNLYKAARAVCDSRYGRNIYFRGLIEFTNYCKNSCYYCGIHNENKVITRYRLTKEEILFCCKQGYMLGYRTFVLQGGEDPYFTDKRLLEIIKQISDSFADCAITLSLGERSDESYLAFFEAGATRYLLRHETATDWHYNKLHPESMSLSNRKRCLYVLKEIGFQTGAGFMVGSPYQTAECLIDDLLFLKELQPHMVGIGPFISHEQTIFKDFENGSVDMTLKMVALTRLLLPESLLPATTALGTMDPNGREKAMSAGANVVMPNLSPLAVREHYSLYDNKICMGEEAAECRSCLESRIRRAGFEPDLSRGDHMMQR